MPGGGDQRQEVLSENTREPCDLSGAGDQRREQVRRGEQSVRVVRWWRGEDILSCGRSDSSKEDQGENTARRPENLKHTPRRLRQEIFENWPGQAICWAFPVSGGKAPCAETVSSRTAGMRELGSTLQGRQARIHRQEVRHAPQADWSAASNVLILSGSKYRHHCRLRASKVLQRFAEAVVQRLSTPATSSSFSPREDVNGVRSLFHVEV